MKSPRWKISAWTLNCAVLALTGSCPAADEGNQYDAIPARNVFDLRPAPVTEPVVATPTPPPGTVKLTGITTIFGPPRALFLVRKTSAPTPAPAGGPPAADESVILTPGERVNGLLLLEVDEAGGTAKVSYHGEEMQLSLPAVAAATGDAGHPGPPNFRPHPELPAGTPPAMVTPPGPASAEEAALLLEANRLANRGGASRPPLPPPGPGMRALLNPP